MFGDTFIPSSCKMCRHISAELLKLERVGISSNPLLPIQSPPSPPSPPPTHSNPSSIQTSIMNNITISNHILDLPRTKKERSNNNKKRKGYHVYVSHFLSDFKLQAKEDQEIMLVNYGIWDELDDVSIDIVMTPRAVKAYEILKVASLR